MSGLLNRFSRQTKSSPARGELGIEQLISAAGMRAYNPDDLVGRKGLAIYDSMRKDGEVKACLRIKQSFIWARGWDIEPPRGDDSAKEIVDFVRYALGKVNGSLTKTIENVCDAIAKGYSVNEIVWDIIPDGKYKGKYYPRYIKSKNPDNYEFEIDEYKNLTGLYNLIAQKTLPIDKFLIYSYNSQYENPYGESDLKAAYKNWWQKDFLQRFWSLHLEKYGSPTIKGMYKRGTPKAKQDELLKTLTAVQQQTAFVIPDDMQADLLETIRQGNTGYLEAVNFHDQQISKAILSQTMITDTGSAVGSFALAKIHLDVLKMTLLGLKRDMEETVIGEQLIKKLVEYNYGPNAPVPVFSLGRLDEKELGPAVDAVCKLIEKGVLLAEDPAILDFLGLDELRNSKRLPIASVSRTREDDGDGNGNNGKVTVS